MSNNILDLYPSTYVKSGDLPANGALFTMTSVMVEQVGRNKEEKPVLYFAEDDSRPLVLNVTNAKEIAKVYGPDYKEWSGKRIVLFPTQVQFGAELVPGIRVRAPKGKAATAPAPQPVLIQPEDGQLEEAPF